MKDVYIKMDRLFIRNGEFAVDVQSVLVLEGMSQT